MKKSSFDIGNGHSVVLEKVVSFLLSGADRAERFVTILLEGVHKIRASDRDGVACFLDAVETKGRRLLNP